VGQSSPLLFQGGVMPTAGEHLTLHSDWSAMSASLP